MKRVLAFFLILILGSWVCSALWEFFGIKITSEILGEFAGSVFTIIYMVWGGILVISGERYLRR